jgi:hypothetical protein
MYYRNPAEILAWGEHGRGMLSGRQPTAAGPVRGEKAGRSAESEVESRRPAGRLRG